MSEEQRQKSPQNPESIPPAPPPLPPVNNSEPAPSDNQNQPPNKTDNTQEVKSEIQEKKQKRWFAENWDKLLNSTISIILAYFTLLLFMETQKSTRIAAESLEAANKAVAESKRANDLSERNFANDSIEGGQQLKMAQSSLAAQIKAFERSQRNFEIANQPYLVLSIPIVRKIEPYTLVELFFTIKNLGKYPVRLVKGTMNVQFRVNPPEFPDFNKIKTESHYMSIFLTEETERMKWEGKGLNQSYYDAAMAGKIYMYTYGFADYENLSNGRLFRYKYMGRTE